MMVRLLSGLVPLLLAMAMLPSPSAAQHRAPADPRAVSLHAFSGKALLGHGNHTGSFQGAMLMRQFHPLGFLGVTAGVISSSDLRLRPDHAERWHHRQFYLLEAMVHFDVVTIRVAESIASRFSFRMGSSYQYGHEVRSFDVTGPGLSSDGPRPVPDFLNDTALYTYTIGGDRYDLRAIEQRSDAVGTFMALETSVEVGPVHVALDGAYRHFPTGTPILSYGLSLGLRY